MLADVSASMGSEAVVLAARLPIADTITAIETQSAAMVLVLVGAALPVIDRTMLLAAIGPLAVTRAPARICALDLGADAAVADVVAAAQFLAGAQSTTGQVLAIG